MEISKEEQRFYPGYYQGRIIPHGPFLEVWANVEQLGNRYEISNYGRFKSLERIVKSGPTCRKIEECFLKLTPIGSGYVRKSVIDIYGRKVNISFHRLVGKYFVDNPENKSFINHIRGFRNDNTFTQIEWCTPSENVNHGYHVLKTPHWSIGRKDGFKCVAIYIATNINTGLKKEYLGTKELRENSLRQTAVNRCIRGERNSYANCNWELKNKNHSGRDKKHYESK